MKNQFLIATISVFCFFTVGCDSDEAVKPVFNAAEAVSMNVTVVRGGTVLEQNETSLSVDVEEEEKSICVLYVIDVPEGYEQATIGGQRIQDVADEVRIEEGETYGEFTMTYHVHETHEDAFELVVTDSRGSQVTHTTAVNLDDDATGNEAFAGEWSSTTLAQVSGMGDVYDVVNAKDGSLLANVGYQLYRSTDDGQSWSTVPMPMKSVTAMAVHPEGAIVAAGASAMIAISNDHGRTWNAIEHNLPKHNCQINSIVADASGQYFLTIVDFVQYDNARAGLYTSTDGLYWTRAENTGLPVAFYDELIIDEKGNLFAFMNNLAQLVRSSDKGATWQKMNIPQQDRFTDIAIFPGGVVLASGSEGMFASSDRGATWQHVFQGIGVSGSSAVECIGLGPDNEVYISVTSTDPNGISKYGVYASTQLDGRYTPLGETMRGKGVTSIRHINNKVFACTAEHGLFYYK